MTVGSRKAHVRWQPRKSARVIDRYISSNGLSCFISAGGVEGRSALPGFQRGHRRVPLRAYGHAFTDWWKKYGAEHPEWFQLVNGQRGPTKPGGSYSMCVSNPEFQHKIVELWKERRAKPRTHSATPPCCWKG